MTLDNLTKTIRSVRSALDAALTKEGCARLDEEEWKNVEEILIASLSKTGVLDHR